MVFLTLTLFASHFALDWVYEEILIAPCHWFTQGRRVVLQSGGLSEWQVGEWSTRMFGLLGVLAAGLRSDVRGWKQVNELSWNFIIEYCGVATWKHTVMYMHHREVEWVGRGGFFHFHAAKQELPSLKLVWWSNASADRDTYDVIIHCKWYRYICQK